MPPPLPNRRQVESRIVLLLLGGLRLKDVAGRDDMPGLSTIRKWAAANPSLRAQMREAQAVGRSDVRAAQAGGFDPVRAEAFLIQVRLGHPVRSLVGQPDWPHREMLDRWKAARPAFAAALAEAVRAADPVRRRRRRRGYDEATGDRIVARLWKGEPLARIVKDPSLPGMATVRRWRREVPEFDTVVRNVARAANGWRARQRTRCTPELTREVCWRIRLGASLLSLSHETGMPSRQTFYRWVATRPDFAEAVLTACEARAQMLVDQADARLAGCDPERLAAMVREGGGTPRRASRLEPYPGARRRAAADR